MLKIVWIGQSAANPRTGASSTTSPEMDVERSRSKWKEPKSLNYGDMVNNMVYTITRVIENVFVGTITVVFIRTIYKE